VSGFSCGFSSRFLARSVECQRRVVVGVAVGVAALKLVVAGSTAGSNDVVHFGFFADVIRRVGWINIYGQHLANPPYNHPPLTGMLLVLLTWLTKYGLSFRFLIRVPAIVADVVTCVLVFELVRIRRSLIEATFAGLVVACSPVLVIISGFHGNTDPVFVMLAMASIYLLVSDRSALLAGVSFAAAISVKLVPVVALPVLLLIAARSGRRRLLAFLVGSGALLALSWGPVVVRQWTGFQHGVLDYSGYSPPQWGIARFAIAAGTSAHGIDLMIGPGRFVVVMLSAGIPLLVAWRRPASATSAFGLSLVIFLLLSTATATQYLAWAAAAACLINVGAAAIYNASAGVFLVVVYDRWNGAAPWAWNRATASPFTQGETVLAAIVWLTLLAVALIGVLSRRDDDKTEVAPTLDRIETLRPATPC
jgi:hypothetical protein